MTADRRIYANFLTATYEVVGNPQAFNACFQNLPGWAGGPTVTAAGLEISFTSSPPDIASLPQAIGAMNGEFYSLFNTGFFMIMAFNPQQPIATFSLYDAIVSGIGLKIIPVPGPDIVEAEAPDVSVDLQAPMNAAGVTSQLAILYDSTNDLFIMSVNGGPIVQTSVPPQSSTGGTVDFFGGALSSGINNNIRYFGVYPPTIDIALMPTYSTVGFVPPAVLGSPAARAIPQRLHTVDTPRNLGLWI